MNHKNLLLILFFCLFLTPFVANGETVGGYFQIDVNVLRDSDNNPISLNNIALYIDEQPTYPDFFTGETIYEGYSYTSLYQELTVGQSYTLGFGNMNAKFVRENAALAGIMVMKVTNATCTTGCAGVGFACDVDAQRALAANITSAERTRLLGSGDNYANAATPARSTSRINSGTCGYYELFAVMVPPADLSTVSCDGSLYYRGSYCRTSWRLCACGGWRIIVTI
jgi:hypothetical protein